MKNIGNDFKKLIRKRFYFTQYIWLPIRRRDTDRSSNSSYSSKRFHHWDNNLRKTNTFHRALTYHPKQLSIAGIFYQKPLTKSKPIATHQSWFRFVLCIVNAFCNDEISWEYNCSFIEATVNLKSSSLNKPVNALANANHPWETHQH